MPYHTEQQFEQYPWMAGFDAAYDAYFQAMYLHGEQVDEADVRHRIGMTQCGSRAGNPWVSNDENGGELQQTMRYGIVTHCARATDKMRIEHRLGNEGSVADRDPVVVFQGGANAFISTINWENRNV